MWGRVAWAPGGDEIVLAALPLVREGAPPTPSAAGPPGASLWRVSVDGGRARQLEGSANAVDVAVSAGGHHLAYSQETRDVDIWRLDLHRKGEAQTRFIASTKRDLNPQFSPDGERVAFTSERSGPLEVWVADGQGGHPLRLTSLGKNGDVGSPRWSPDGRSIAFDFCEKNCDVYVVSALGGPPRRVTTASSADVTPSWSRDGRWIYFSSDRSGQWQVWKVAPDGEEAGSARQVTRRGGFAPTESIDGRYVYFSKRHSRDPDPDNAIWRMPVEGGDEQAVIESLRSSWGNWGVTAEGIYFVDQKPSPQGCDGWSSSWASTGAVRPRWHSSVILPFFEGLPSASLPMATGFSRHSGRWHPI